MKELCKDRDLQPPRRIGVAHILGTMISPNFIAQNQSRRS